MYEKLSDKLDRVVQHADAIAREYGHEYVDTEHLLLGIFREGTGGAVKLLRAGGADEKRVKDAIDRLVDKPRLDTVVMGRLPGTPHYRSAIAKAIEAARKYRSKTVCTEHLLLALLQEKGGVAHAALAALGIQASTIRDALTDETAKR